MCPGGRWRWPGAPAGRSESGTPIVDSSQCAYIGGQAPEWGLRGVGQTAPDKPLSLQFEADEVFAIL